MMKIISPIILVFFLLLGAEFTYFAFVFQNLRTAPPEDFDVVLKYTDSGSINVPFQWAVHYRKPIYVSKAPWEGDPFHGRFPAGLEVHIDPRGRTTDSNSRYAAPFIISRGYRRVLLVVDWAHVPRALFLTRLYLLGSSVSVIPCPSEEVPTGWWHRKEFWIEMGKFWGSLGRVVLAAIGLETGPSKQLSA